MKNNLIRAALLTLSTFSLISCSSLETISKDPSLAAGDVITINIANSDDYIWKDEDTGRTLVDDFVDYVKATDGVTLKVNYSVFSTPEEILSKVTAGTASYDLVNNSDYIIQKMLGLDMLEPFVTGEERKALYGDTYSAWEDDYYEEYASPFLLSLLNGIKAKVKTPNGVEERNLGNYARGYMWGTLGITYNPGFKDYKSRGLSEDDVKVQMCDWNAMWNPAYHGTFQIKDSMRDTYAIGLMHIYDNYFQTLRTWYINGKRSDGTSYSKNDYQNDAKIIFNNLNYLEEFNALAKKIDSNAPIYTVDEIIGEVQAALVTLKNNSFGMEVDSGKTDITTGKKSGIDVAWSGDAITSMDLGDGNSANPVSLYYSVPLTGGNIWSDNWIMLKMNVGGNALKKQYCQKFIDFISNPEIVVRNMDYIGYTSFIGGPEVLSYVRESYDPRTYAMYVYDEENEEFLLDEEENYVYLDGSGVHDGYDYGEVDMRGSSYKAPRINGSDKTWEEFAHDVAKEDWRKIDLTYFFSGDNSDEDTLKGSDLEAGVDTIFYSNEIEEVTGKNLKGEEETVLVGRQFLAQYPVEDETLKGSSLCSIPSLAIMEDYGNNSAIVLTMWEMVKSSPLPLWALILLISEGVVVAIGVTTYLTTKNISKRLRKKRREEKNA